MKIRRRFALKQTERGMPVPGARRKMGVSGATFFNWRKKCGSLGPSGLHSDRRLLYQICGTREKATADPRLDTPAMAVKSPRDLARVSGKQQAVTPDQFLEALRCATKLKACGGDNESHAESLSNGWLQGRVSRRCQRRQHRFALRRWEVTRHGLAETASALADRVGRCWRGSVERRLDLPDASGRKNAT
jgi:hypothetical protein